MTHAAPMLSAGGETIKASPYRLRTVPPSTRDCGPGRFITVSSASDIARIIQAYMSRVNL